MFKSGQIVTVVGRKAKGSLAGATVKVLRINYNANVASVRLVKDYNGWKAGTEFTTSRILLHRIEK